MKEEHGAGREHAGREARDGQQDRASIRSAGAGDLGAGRLGDPREDFLRGLKRKAGLAATYWSDALRLERFEVVKFSEGSPA